MADLRSFANKMRDISSAIEHAAGEMTRRTAVAVDTAVVMATPVDTGRARANWQAGIGAPVEGTTEDVSESGAGAIAEASSKIAGYKGGSVIHITNNLPYIQALNDGHSAQAPAGFVEHAVDVGAKAAKSSTSVIRDALRGKKT